MDELLQLRWVQLAEFCDKPPIPSGAGALSIHNVGGLIRNLQNRCNNSTLAWCSLWCPFNTNQNLGFPQKTEGQRSCPSRPLARGGLAGGVAKAPQLLGGGLAHSEPGARVGSWAIAKQNRGQRVNGLDCHWVGFVRLHFFGKGVFHESFELFAGG